MLEAIGFIGALLLYTVAIWTHHAKGLRQGNHIALSGPLLSIFAAAFTLDVLSTMWVCGIHKWSWTLHTISGTIALVIMGLHLWWGYSSSKVDNAGRRLFHRLSPIAWFVWLVSFVSGIP